MDSEPRPLGWWGRLGLDTELIRTRTPREDISEHPVLGTCYIVRLDGYREATGERFRERMDVEREMPVPMVADLRARSIQDGPGRSRSPPAARTLALPLPPLDRRFGQPRSPCSSADSAEEERAARGSSWKSGM